MHFNGKHGAAPPWWWVWQQAKSLGVPPWTISGEYRPCYRYWRDRELVLNAALYEAGHWETETKS